MNFYGMTKQFVEDSIREEQWDNIYALRFFNVFGKFENDKGTMASVVHKWLSQDVSMDNPIKIYKSTDSKYADGEQRRDFVYAEDVCSVILHCMKTNLPGGIFNVGSGNATSWNEMASCVLASKDLPIDMIEYIDMPDSIRSHYQNFTQANLDKLRNTLGYVKPFTSLVDGVEKTRAWMKEEGIIA